MSKILIIGCGGVASVAIRKCAEKADVFSEICIASRTVAKCNALKEKLEGKTKAKITTAEVDADNVEELVALMNREQPKAVLNLALPYQRRFHFGCRMICPAPQSILAYPWPTYHLHR